MKRIFAISTLWLVLAMALVAGPGSNIPVQVKQPNGVTFWAQIKGDEHQRWVETLAGYTVMRNNVNRVWEFALPAKSGGLRTSGLAVPANGIAPANLPKHLVPAREWEAERATARRLQLKAAGEWDPTLISGTRRLLFIAVSFNDRQLVTTAADWDGAIFDQTPGLKTVANYYDDNSQGLLMPVPAPNTQTTNPGGGIVTVSINRNHPNTGHANLPVNRQYKVETQWINDALAAASAHVDFPALDTNGDGDLTLDEAVVYFIVAGYDASGSTNEPNVWGHKWGTSRAGDVEVNGVEVNRWAINGELYDTGDRHSIGVVTHELGHLMCFLPDLYDIAGSNAAMGIFSLMSGGSWGTAAGDNIPGATPVNMDAWCRSVIGWAQPRRPGPTDSVSFDLPLSGIDSPVMLRDDATTLYEYFLVENRAPSGWDLGMQATLETADSEVTSQGNTIASDPMTYSPTGTATGIAVDCGLGQVGEFPPAVNGQIALISRGDISFVDKVVNAKNAGALAAIIYNNTAGPLDGTLGTPGNYIPAVGIAQADGPGLAGQTVTVTVLGVAWSGGLLIQHVDETVGTSASNNINSSSNAHQGITVVEADPTLGSLLDPNGTSGRTGHLFYAGNNADFGPSTNPNSDYWNGNASGLGIYNISSAGSTMTASMSPVVGPQAPVANFSHSADGLSVDFTDTSVDGDGSIVSWDWDFGDGNGSISQHPSHAYASAGSYTVTLTVTDNDSLTGTHSATVTVSDNAAPTAAFSHTVNGLSADFTDLSSDSDGSIVSWSWDFGDGNGSSSQNPSHGYASAGSYTVTLTVTDNDGATDSTSQSVTVTAPGGTVTDTFSGNVRGQQSASHSVSVSGGVIDISLTWDNSHDLDVVLYGPGGGQVASATTGAKPETLSYDTNGAGGAYTVQIINNYNRRNQRANYTLDVTYEN